MTGSRAALRPLALLLSALAAAWPLMLLVDGSRAIVPAAAVVVAVVMTGVLCRLRPLPAIATLAAQLLVSAVAIALAMASLGISPAPGNLRNLASDLQKTVQEQSAPLPSTPACIVMLLAAAALVALVVDVCGGTARMTLFAAIPIIAPFVLVATALGGVLAIHYFVIAALAWALLLLSESGSENHRRRWSWPNLAVFAAMAAAAIVAALLIAPEVPQRPAPILAEGGSTGIDTSIDFSKSLDLRKSLHSTSSAAVLMYTTNATTPAPLRVTTSSVYSNGVWQATALQGPFTSVKNLENLSTPGLVSSVPTVQERTTVTANGIHAPLIAAPAPLAEANFGSNNQSFQIVTATGVPLVRHAPKAYAVLSRDFTAAARPTSDAAVTTATPTVTAADLDVSQLPHDARTGLQSLIATAEPTASSRFDRAVQLQRYLRLSGGFRYSLTAPPTQVNGKQLDPISAFLAVKEGYCTQFATAMIMAARLQGIPARMAIGFLPGTTTGATHLVHASDAHAWPELYFPGMGWTRFDPTTPSRSGTAPAYAPDNTTAPSRRPSASTSSSSVSSTSTKTTPHPSTTTSSDVRTTAHHSSHILRDVLAALAALAAVAALASILPLAGRAERGRLLRNAGSDNERAEGHWHAMRWHLADLGLPLVVGRSPRATVDEFTRESSTTPELEDALGRAADSVEASRYAPGGSTRAVGPATDRVVTAARDHASRFTRVRAWILPASGVEFFRRLVRRGR